MKRVFNTIAVFLAAAIVFSTVSGGYDLSLKAYAANGNTFTEPTGIVWTVDVNTGTLTISGEGAMKDAAYSPIGSDIASTIGPLGQYVKNVVIESGITHIGNNAFWFPEGNSQIESITIPDSITSIGTGAFRMSRKLSGLTVPEGCSAGEYAFSGCPLLSGISEEIIASGTFGESVSWTINNAGVLDISGTGIIPEGGPFSPPFPPAASVTDVKIGEGITGIEDGAFYNSSTISNYNYISNVSLPGSLERIGSNAFETCSRLSHVYYDGLQEDWARVEGSSALQLPSSCTIDFMEPVDSGTCGTDLTWAYYPNGRLEITGTGDMYDYEYSGSNVSPWNDYESEMSIIVIGPGVTSIGNYAFYDCQASALVIRDASLVIKDKAFWRNYLTEINWGTGNVTIGYSSFNQSVMLESLVLPANISLTEDSAMAFANGAKLESVTAECEVIGEEMFYNCKKLSEVTFGRQVRTLMYEAFYGNTSLNTVVIPAGVTSIGRRAFLDSSLHQIYFEGTEFSCVTNVGSGFNMWNYGGSVTVHAPECSKAHYMAQVYHNNFAVLEGDTSEHFYEDQPSWSWSGDHLEAHAAFTCSVHGDSSFSVESGEVRITLQRIAGTGYRRIYQASAEYNGTFYSGQYVETVSLETLLRGSCGDPSVNRGRNLRWEYDQSSGTILFFGSGDMKNYAADDPTIWKMLELPVSNVVFEDGITSVGSYAFDGCTNIETAELTESITKLAADAFVGCTGLTAVTIPDSVEQITGDFSGAPNLTDIYYYGTEEEWEAYNVTLADTVTVHYQVFHPAAYMVLDSSIVYDGVNCPAVSVYRKSGGSIPEDTLLAEGTDYLLTYENNENVGTAVAVVTGIGEYEGIMRQEYTITARQITLGVLLKAAYNGEEQTVTVTPEGAEGLAKGHTLTLSNAFMTGKDAGIYTEISDYGWRVSDAEGADVSSNYQLTLNAEFEITRAQPDQLGLRAEGYDAPYDGEAHGISVTVNEPERTKIYYSLVSPLDPTFNDSCWQEEAPTWTDFTDGAKSVYVKAENPNYFSPMASADVKITKRRVQITVPNVEKNLGEPDPEFPDAVMEGAVGDELSAVDLSVFRSDHSENEGMYTLHTRASAEGLNKTYTNYEFYCQVGFLTICGEPLVILVQPVSVRAKAGERVTLSVTVNRPCSCVWENSFEGVAWKSCSPASLYNRASVTFRMNSNVDGRYFRCKIYTAVETIYSDVVQVILDDGTPLPIPLAAVNGAGGIRVTWTPPSVYDTGTYDVWRKEEGGSFVKISTSPHGATGLTDTDVVFGTKYTYKVTRGPDNSPTAASEEVTIIRNPFTDVPENASYFKRLVWAVNNGIISGTSKTTFSPNDDCTRYQFAQMIYKLAGKPKVSGVNLPFTDVPETANYYKAVCWAYSNGIISGTSKTTFSPNVPVTRYQVVQMLYKMKGKPAVSGSSPFTDVPADASYYKAVLWAVQNKITSGTTATTFSPMDSCQRYQMVVFLEKYSKLP